MFPIETAKYCDNLSKVVGVTFSMQITKLCGKLSKVVGQTSQTPPPSQPPSAFLKRLDGNFECDFSVKY